MVTLTDEDTKNVQAEMPEMTAAKKALKAPERVSLTEDRGEEA